MLKLVIFILFLCALYLLWRLFAKHKINSVIDEQRQDLSQMIQQPVKEDELPEKTKIIKQMIDEERQKTAIEVEKRESNIDHDEEIIATNEVVEAPITDEDQQLFDAAAQMFFEKALHIRDAQQAEKIQQDLLCKMPMNTQSQVCSFDFGEWSVFWHYHEQSLEYYVGRYGVFYAHVDRDGIEHKIEFKDAI